MCGINGVINFRGLTQMDLYHGTRMCVYNQTRGSMATGIAAQNMEHMKAPQPAEVFVRREKYNHFIERAAGKKWAVWHTRHATQGDPRDNRNNHPITVRYGEFMMIHNGVVGSAVVEEDSNMTDSYVIAKAISREWIQNDLFTTVQNAFKLFHGFAALAVISKSEIVIARRTNPVVFGKLKPSGAIIFSSTEINLKAGTENVENIEEMADNTIIGFDKSGRRRTGTIATVASPVRVYNWDEARPTRQATLPRGVFRPHQIHREDVPAASDADRPNQEHQAKPAKPLTEEFEEPVYDEYQNYLGRRRWIRHGDKWMLAGSGSPSSASSPRREFQRGDLVRIWRRFTEEEGKPASLRWHSRMDKTIGRVGKVQRVESDGTIYVVFNNDYYNNRYAYVAQALKKDTDAKAMGFGERIKKGAANFLRKAVHVRGHNREFDYIG